jgi:multidrug efflux pump
LFGLFNRGMEKTKEGYSGVVRWTLVRTGRLMLIYVAIVIAMGWAFMRLPAGFLPVDDQGFLTADVQTPPEASFNRTLEAVQRVEAFLAQRKGVDNVTFLTGFSFLGQGQNTAQAFVTLKDWSERGANDSAEAIVADINKSLSTTISDAKISALQPPPIDNLGNSSGFSFRLQDRAQRGYVELMRAKDQLLTAAKKSPILQNVYVEGLAPAPQVELVIDREKAAALGVTFQDINRTISTNL